MIIYGIVGFCFTCNGGNGNTIHAHTQAHTHKHTHANTNTPVGRPALGTLASVARSWFETSSRPPRSVEACQCDPKTILVTFQKILLAIDWLLLSVVCESVCESILK